MESDHVAESQALKQLEALVRNLGEEMASFRRRAQSAEHRVRVLETALAQRESAEAAPPDPERVRALEQEVAELRARLGFATERTDQLLSRVRFLRQQNGRSVNSHASVSGEES